MYANISMKDFYQRASQEKLNIIDVRPAEGFSAGHVPTAINIPLEILPAHLAELSQEKEYFIICRSGHRSALASEFLTEAGYQVTNVEEGTLAWPGELAK